ncbi:MAG TPA: NADH-quinone oxidoreductase subunit K [Jiangellales bacterium]|nr:NADH-quinone oxidoreductase subunit K [Jiangellales bacterium]
MSVAVAVAVLVAGGVYLVLQRGLVRVAFGFVLLGHAANLVLVSAGGVGSRTAPLIGDATAGELATTADPLPQAFALTAIVITFGITVYLLALVSAGADDDPDPDTDATQDSGSRTGDPTEGAP